MSYLSCGCTWIAATSAGHSCTNSGASKHGRFNLVLDSNVGLSVCIGQREITVKRLEELFEKSVSHGAGLCLVLEACFNFFPEELALEEVRAFAGASYPSRHVGVAFHWRFTCMEEE